MSGAGAGGSGAGGSGNGGAGVGGSGTAGLEISSGGAVAVDTGSLRHAAERFHGVARRLGGLTGSLRRECVRLQHSAGSWGWALPGRLFAAGDIAGALADRADGLGAKLTDAAGVYEVVELRVAMQQADAAGDVPAVERAAAALLAVTAAHPGAAAEAERLSLAHGLGVLGEDARVGAGLTWIPPLGAAAGVAGGSAVALLGRGQMGAGTTGAPPPPVRVHQVGGTVSGPAPADLADVISRIPSGEPGRRPLVRVEKYTMPDASHRFMVYVTGTRNMDLNRTTDPSDMASNVRLYAGASSASLVAVQRALADAGAKRGDIVNPVGHSQGGMIAGRLALDGGYRTTMLVTAGSPTEAQVSRNVLSVQLQHPDVVSDLTGGGSAGQVGSRGSVVIRRDPHAEGGPLAAHDLGRYVETAREADESGDPRMGGVRDQLAQLRRGTTVEVREYDAELIVQPVRVPDPRSVPGVDGPFVGAVRG